MPPSLTRGRAYYVTACQQLLALAVVVAALTPATGIVRLDVVPSAPSAQTITISPMASVRHDDALVPTAPVDAVVHEYPLAGPGADDARTVTGRHGVVRLVGAPQPVSGYGAVGVTWEHGEDLPEDALGLQARTRTGGTWSSWTALDYDPDHAPDPDTREGRHARPGTEPLFVGHVDEVQVRVEAPAGATGTRALPDDLRMAVVDPGHATSETTERPAIDTATLDGTSDTATAAAADTDARPGVTPKPQIFSRAQWGADESMRDKPSLHYGEVHAGFVHHTVNANDYTRAEVPGIIRSIYAYHVRSKGWSDIGYNFLVDRFGRIWEGRYGGVDRPVVGAHTLGYNDDAFAMSAIGNYEIARPSQAIISAYGALFAWKLSLHGVDAASTRQRVAGRTFQAINGHRDAGQTACPGRYLYARLPDIRRLAAADQASWAARDLRTDLVQSAHPDLVARRTSDHHIVLVPNHGLSAVRAPRLVSSDWGRYDGVVGSTDLTGDGVPDLVGVRATGAVEVRPGGQDGVYPRSGSVVQATRGSDLVAAPGDVDGDGHADLVSRDSASGALVLARGAGDGTFTETSLGGDWSRFALLAGSGDVDGDGHPDLVARASDGSMWLARGTGSGFAEPTRLPSARGPWDVVAPAGDWNHDGHPDLFVRKKGAHAFVLPNLGDGTFGHRIGPIKRLRDRAGLATVPVTSGAAGGSVDVISLDGSDLRVLANKGGYESGAAVDTGIGAKNAVALLDAGDWDGDGHGDVLLVDRRGRAKVRLGDGAGHFGPLQRIGGGFAHMRTLDVVGDVTGDGLPDLMGQPMGGDVRIWPGRGTERLGASYVAHSAVSGGSLLGVGLWNGDGAPDVMVRDGDQLSLYPGNGPGGIMTPSKVGLDLGPYDRLVGVSSVRPNGHADLVARERSTGDLWLFEGRPGSLAPRHYLADGGDYDLID
ncbi:FG-GAP-like repeat-containing protein [Nocardioides acrostichi]|uniref:VCBS repeat-containing protein n=1 Tax=Nocardioides acrostichi TaxID=2784339 RepID=A0A930UVX7_9ACTN|nr:FG-GAP-like repeat-containing protein [Nocardioides acrostichi]MBF4161848.1 VCBS repeat-containing protein [Nocardioides acrostichi]